MRRRRAGREADRARLHRFADQRLHRSNLRVGRCAQGSITTHDESAHAAVSDVRCDVDRAALTAQLSEVLRKGFEPPIDALAQDVERHALDVREIAHRPLAVLGLAGCDGEAAVADHCSRDPERRRRAHARVPRDLRVEMCVAVDDPGHQREPVRIDDLRRRTRKLAADGPYTAALGHDVAHDRRSAAAVEHQGVPEV
jgi:hypothetical protein